MTRALIAVLVGMCLAPAAADAATVSLTAGALTVTAAPGETNAIAVIGSGSLIGTVTVIDGGAAITPGGSCAALDAGTVKCPGTGTAIVSTMTASLGDGDDSIGVNLDDATTVTVFGGGGADTISGSAGKDMIDGGPGTDIINGGGGVDTVDYSARTNPVTVTLDGTAGSGEAFEADTIGFDVEGVKGGLGADRITGNDGPNALYGGAGTDVLFGLGEADTLNGGAGSDRLDGDDGDDVFDQDTAADGADVMNGGAGTDSANYDRRAAAGVTVDIDGMADDGQGGVAEGDNVQMDVENLLGSSRGDTLVGSSDPNRIDGRAGADNVSGGAGNDTLVEVLATDSDVFSGGDGIDTVDYTLRSTALAVSLDDVANDGDSAASEGDNVKADVENVTGGSGADLLIGDDDANVLSGARGNDTFDGRGGADVFLGGPHTDTVDYSLRTAPVTVGPELPADDGEAGEGDTVSGDIENIKGGSGDDVLTGSALANTLEGRDGNDALNGGTGVDVLRPGAGDDTVLSSDTSADDVACGAGTDGVTADLLDVVASDCETVSRPGDPTDPTDPTDPKDPTDPGDPPPTDPPPTDPTEPAFPTDPGYPTEPEYPYPDYPDYPDYPEPGASPADSPGAGDVVAPQIAIEVFRRKLRRVLRGGLELDAGCFERCSLAVKLRLSRKTAKKLGLSRTVGKASLGLSRPGMNHLTAAIARRAKRKLKRAHSIRFSLVVVATDASGNRSVARRGVRVRR